MTGFEDIGALSGLDVSVRGQGYIRQRIQRLFKRVTPLSRDRLELLVVRLHTADMFLDEAVRLVAEVVERRSDRKIGLQGRVEADQQELHRAFETQVGVVGADEDGAAVLDLADLKEWRVLSGFDEVALGIDQEQARRAARDLAAKNQGRIEIAFGTLTAILEVADDLAQRVAHHAGRLKH